MLAARSGEQSLWRPGLAVLYAELGMIEESRTGARRLGPGGFASVPRDSVWPACLTFLAEACIACGADEHAAVLLHELDALAGRNLMVGMTICFGPADRLARRTRRDPRVGWQRPSRTSMPRWHWPIGVPHRCGERECNATGRAWLLRRNDLAAARAMAVEAQATALALGMQALAAQASHLLEGLGAPGLRYRAAMGCRSASWRCCG